MYLFVRKYYPAIGGLVASASVAYSLSMNDDEGAYNHKIRQHYAPRNHLFRIGYMADSMINTNSTPNRDITNVAIGLRSPSQTDKAGTGQTVEFQPPERPDLPVFRMDEVKKHNQTQDSKQRIWVTFKNGVYDVTDFAGSHPGGDKILLAAGGSVEPFWAIYAQHNTKEVAEILEELRIGSLDVEDLKASMAQKRDVNDPFSTDPIRHPALIINSQKPFNAETPPSLLIDDFRTPNQLFFVRNHMPVPQTNADTHKLQLDGIGLKRSVSLSVKDLKMNYEPVSVTSTVQCAGNRRNDMNDFKKVQGLMWTGTAISNAKWTGCRLRDVLMVAGVDPNDRRIKHVHFEGADTDPTGTCYGASIPFEKAMQPEVIIAYQMNDADIPPDHGYPIRIIAPGVVGARQVKWVTKIHISDVESPSHWQQKDYKAFPPNVQIGDTPDFNSVPAIQEYPVQSAICVPAPNAKVNRENGAIEVCGYAWSGGGRGIIRVEVSVDGGKTWESAALQQDPDQDLDHMWAWTLWRAEVKIPKEGDKFMLVCKATDRAYNTQPETATGLWNVRGLLHNAWHRVPIVIT
ncbi:oxidoreductase molybdopterin binding domain-containing protein [Ditylenchus destructor]|uniref:sulfite oxidase n=1 Tax=Ditylenchus destructor TaxID=166010 RepID=A0AAD4R8C6_9BILA|nr:oxidoreductase molybdopterin binding domain-containing protein [Ditylenchus destructor]